jgi:hypothetical protein
MLVKPNQRPPAEISVKNNAEMVVYIPPSHIKDFSPAERAAVEAAKGLTVCMYSHVELSGIMLKLIIEAWVLMGLNQVNKDEEQLMTAKALAAKLQYSFKSFTVEHVMQAVRSGACGDLEDKIVHISVAGICKWLHLWNDKVRREAMHKFNKIEALKQSEEKKQESIQQLRVDIEKAYSNFLEFEILNNEFEEWYYAAMFSNIEKEFVVDYGFGSSKEEIDKAKWDLWPSIEMQVKEEIPFDEQKKKGKQLRDYLNLVNVFGVTRARYTALQISFEYFKSKGKVKVFDEM